MPETLEVISRREGDVGILETEGYISDPAAEKIAEAGETLIQEGIKHLVMNLEKWEIILPL